MLYSDKAPVETYSSNINVNAYINSRHIDSSIIVASYQYCISDGMCLKEAVFILHASAADFPSTATIVTAATTISSTGSTYTLLSVLQASERLSDG
jgi:hypothetical protein